MLIKLIAAAGLVAPVATVGVAARPAATFPRGVFATTISDGDLIAGHAPQDLPENHGTFTLTLAGGRFRLVQRAPNPLRTPVGTGIYSVAGNRVVFKLEAPRELSGGIVRAGWRFDGRALRFSVPAGDPDYRVIFSAHPWRRIR